jgi:hypothetical protein
MDGFDFSHQSGVSLILLRKLRATVVQGLSVNGFCLSLLQMKREHHLMLAIQWRDYVDQLQRNRSLMGPSIQQLNELQKRDFVDVDSDEYDEEDPCVAWLVCRLMIYMESDAEQRKRRMQLIDGEHLSGDHSFKLTKCITSGGSKPFMATYCLLNEFNQVVAFWFTTGTGMSELESSIAKIKDQYRRYGYKGPSFATTDRCCHERAFWTRVFELDSEAADDTQFLTDDDVNEIDVVAAPRLGEIASTIEMCDIFVGWISDELVKLPPEQQVIIVDGEWRVGSPRMDLLIICLPFSDYKVYIFQLTRMCNNDERHFSRALRKLLEDHKIKKVGNRIPCDVAKLQKWNVEMGPL